MKRSRSDTDTTHDDTDVHNIYTIRNTTYFEVEYELSTSGTEILPEDKSRVYVFSVLNGHNIFETIQEHLTLLDKYHVKRLRVVPSCPGCRDNCGAQLPHMEPPFGCLAERS